jgi:hypothetical protein
VAVSIAAIASASLVACVSVSLSATYTRRPSGAA